MADVKSTPEKKPPQFAPPWGRRFQSIAIPTRAPIGGSSTGAIEVGLAWPLERQLSSAADAFKIFMQLTFGGPGSGIKPL